MSHLSRLFGSPYNVKEPFGSSSPVPDCIRCSDGSNMGSAWSIETYFRIHQYSLYLPSWLQGRDQAKAILRMPWGQAPLSTHWKE